MSRLKSLRAPVLALFSRGIGLLLQFLMNIALSRLLGTAGMGVYSLYTSWMMVLSSAAGMGMPNHTLRTVSVLEGSGERAAATKFTTRVLMLLLLTGAVVTFVIALLAGEVAEPLLGENGMDVVLVYAALAATFFIMIRVLSEAFKGLQKVNHALTMETVLLPLGVLIALALLYISDSDLTAEGFLGLHVSILLILTIFMFLMLKRFGKSAQEDEKPLPILLDRCLLPFWGGALLNMWFMNMPILLLPQFASADEIGIFGVVYRLIALASTILFTLASVFGPRYARDYANGDVQALKRGLRQSQLYSLGIFAPILIVFTFFAEPLLSIFGEEFIQGKHLLWIMAAGQLLNSATGLVGNMMNMIHQEKQEFYIQVSVTILVFILIFVLGSNYGVTGVAVAYAIGITVKNLMSLFFSMHHLNRMGQEVVQAA